MWMYLGPSCPDRPFFVEFGDAKMNTWIHKVLVHGADSNPRAGPAPLRERVDNTKVSLITFAFGSLHSLICFLRSCLPQDLVHARRAPQGSPYLRTL
jgi:hypothetical protein